MKVKPCPYSGLRPVRIVPGEQRDAVRGPGPDLGFDGMELADEPHTLFAIGAVPARVISTSLRRAWAQQ